MILTKRLSAIAGFIPNGARVADVGADHAKLSHWLADNLGAFCIATDINPKPLERAKANLPDNPRISFRLGDGLTCIAPDEVDVVVIAGTGGETAADILAASSWSRGKLCVLQPASRADRLRRFCYEHGYELTAETVVSDAGRWCPVFTTKSAAPRRMSADNYFVSPALRASASPEVSVYAEKQIKWLRGVLSHLRHDLRPGRQELAKYYNEALSGLTQWKGERE